ncbi:hypothetical protein A2U01_0056226, partial [Trifolium medium]|nr:hypothetical protein [Trifolium medium]
MGVMQVNSVVGFLGRGEVRLSLGWESMILSHHG